MLTEQIIGPFLFQKSELPLPATETALTIELRKRGVKMKNIIHAGRGRIVTAGLALLMLGLSGNFLALPPIFTSAGALAQGNTYYVASNGNDANSGSISQPWRHIQKAANTLQPGDTVYIRAGAYAEKVLPKNSGQVGGYITYAAYPGEVVTIDGTGIPLADNLTGLFHIDYKKYIKVSGLKVINAGPHKDNAGILVTYSSHIILEKNYTYNTISSGIGVWVSQNVTVDGNEIVRACNGGYEENLTIARTTLFEVKNNHVHDGGPGINGNGSIGIDVKEGSAEGKIHHNHVHQVGLGLYVDAYDKHTYNLEVYQNSIHDTTNGVVLASERGGLLENVKFYNNLVYNNRYVGISLTRNGTASMTQPLRNIQLFNNTVYHNGLGTWGGGIWLTNQDAQGVVIRNNICSGNLSFQIAAEGIAPAGFTVDHNLVYPFKGYPGAFHGSVEADPMFMNAAAADFHLQPASPAVDQGLSPDAPLFDYEELPRPQDGDDDGTPLVDLGAFELTLLFARPNFRIVDPGGVATYTLVIGPNFTGPVNLTAASPSPNLSVEVNPGSVNPSAQAVVTVTDHHPGPTLKPAELYNVRVTATGGSAHSTSLSIIVGGERTYLPIVLQNQ